MPKEIYVGPDDRVWAPMPSWTPNPDVSYKLRVFKPEGSMLREYESDRDRDKGKQWYKARGIRTRRI